MKDSIHLDESDGPPWRFQQFWSFVDILFVSYKHESEFLIKQLRNNERENVTIESAPLHCVGGYLGGNILSVLSYKPFTEFGIMFFQLRHLVHARHHTSWAQDTQTPHQDIALENTRRMHLEAEEAAAPEKDSQTLTYLQVRRHAEEHGAELDRLSSRSP